MNIDKKLEMQHTFWFFLSDFFFDPKFNPDDFCDRDGKRGGKRGKRRKKGKKGVK
jgi:hypothetical protein